MITASSVNAYTTCPRKFKYSYVDEQVPVAPQVPLLTGTAVHIGIEAFWNKKEFGYAINDIREFQDENEFWQTDKGRLENLRVLAYLTGYYSHRRLIRADHEVVAVEHEWKKVIDGIEFAGKIDLVLRDKNGRLVLVDHKTSASTDVENPGSSFWAGLCFDTQMILYREALSEIAESNGAPVLVYDVVRKTKSKPAQKKKIAKRKVETPLEYAVRKEQNTETVSEYGRRILREYGENEERFIWREIPITQDEATNKTIEILQIAKTMSAEHAVYPRFQNSCVSRYGPCPYFNVCCGTDSITGMNFKRKPAHSELLNQGEKNGKSV
mgnify:CR=1 FL=1